MISYKFSYKILIYTSDEKLDNLENKLPIIINFRLAYLWLTNSKLWGVTYWWLVVTGCVLVNVLSSNTPTQDENGYMVTIFSLEAKPENGFGNKDFIKKLASWSWEGTGKSLRTPTWTLSRTIWQTISKCLIHSWKTGFAAMCIALWLSQYNIGGLEHDIWRSWSKYKSHWISQVTIVKMRYSASLEERILKISTCQKQTSLCQGN